MRDALLTLIVGGLLVWVLKRPHIGVLVWSWLSYMNPHRMTWGFAYALPFAQLTAVFTLLSLFFSKEPRTRFPATPLTVTWILLLIWMGITTATAFNPEAALSSYIQLLKIQLFCFLTILLMGSRERINMLVWVIVISIGIFGVKGGIFTITTGGQWKVYGPSGSFIQENNGLALATLMVLPLVAYLRTQTENVWIRRALLVSMLLMAVSIAGSHSRGAFVAAFGLGFFLWLKTPRKLLTGPIIVILTVVVILAMPEGYRERMRTIETYQEDASAMNRIAAWTMSIRIASRNITGGGFKLWSAESWRAYGGDLKNMARGNRAAHSIYFGMLAEQGWLGLMLFLLVFFLTWRSGSWIIRNSRTCPSLSWASDFARMVQVSLVAYALSGAFLGMHMFDLPWQLVSMIVLTRTLVAKQLEENRQTIPKKMGVTLGQQSKGLVKA